MMFLIIHHLSSYLINLTRKKNQLIFIDEIFYLPKSAILTWDASSRRRFSGLKNFNKFEIIFMKSNFTWDHDEPKEKINKNKKNDKF